MELCYSVLQSGDDEDQARRSDRTAKALGRRAMTARFPDFGLRARAAAIFGCLLLTVCATPTTTHWVKTGSDEATTQRQVQACRAQANAVLGTQMGINQDI